MPLARLSRRVAVLFKVQLGDAQPWAQDRAPHEIAAADAPFASAATGLMFYF